MDGSAGAACRTEAATNTAGGGATLAVTPSGNNGRVAASSSALGGAPSVSAGGGVVSRPGGAPDPLGAGGCVLSTWSKICGPSKPVTCALNTSPGMQAGRQRGRDAVAENLNQVGQAVRREHLRGYDLALGDLRLQHLRLGGQSVDLARDQLLDRGICRAGCGSGRVDGGRVDRHQLDTGSLRAKVDQVRGTVRQSRRLVNDFVKGIARLALALAALAARLLPFLLPVSDLDPVTLEVGRLGNALGALLRSSRRIQPERRPGQRPARSRPADWRAEP